MSKAERIEVLVDLLRADAKWVSGGTQNIFDYNGKAYLVVTEAERNENRPDSCDWRWIGQLGLTHVYRLV